MRRPSNNQLMSSLHRYCTEACQPALQLEPVGEVLVACPRFFGSPYLLRTLSSAFHSVFLRRHFSNHQPALLTDFILIAAVFSDRLCCRPRPLLLLHHVRPASPSFPASTLPLLAGRSTPDPLPSSSSDDNELPDTTYLEAKCRDADDQFRMIRTERLGSMERNIVRRT